jgi:hypothetical protein
MVFGASSHGILGISVTSLANTLQSLPQRSPVLEMNGLIWPESTRKSSFLGFGGNIQGSALDMAAKRATIVVQEE